MRWTDTAAEKLRRGLRRLPAGSRDAAPDGARLSVVVTVTGTSEALLDACLERVRAADLDAQVVEYGPGTAVPSLDAARHVGVERAEGEWVLLLEPTDLVNAEAVAAVLARLGEGTASLAVGGFTLPASVGARNVVGVEDAPALLATAGDLGTMLLRKDDWLAAVQRHGGRRPAGEDSGDVVAAAVVAATLMLAAPVVVTPERLSWPAPESQPPFGTLPDRSAAVTGWAASVREIGNLLAEDRREGVLERWLAALLTSVGVDYLDSAAHLSHEQWGVLHGALVPLVASAREELWTALPWELRTKTRLLVQGEREALEELVHRRQLEGPDHPTEVREGLVLATCWPRGDAALGLPESCFVLADEETPLVVSVRNARWLGSDVLELDVFAWIEKVGDLQGPVELLAELVGPGDARVRLEVAPEPSPEVTRVAGETFHDHDRGGWRVRVRRDQLEGTGTWSPTFLLTVAGVTRSAGVTHREPNGVVGQRPHRLCDGLVWGPSPDGPHGVVVETRTAETVLTEALVEGRTLRGRIESERAVSRLRLTSAAAAVEAAVRDGRFEITLSEAAPAGEDARPWQVHAMVEDGTELPVVFPQTDEDWVTDDAGSLAWWRASAGAATVREITAKVMVDDVTLDGDDLVVSLAWLGEPPAAWSLALSGPRVELPGTREPGADAEVSRVRKVRIPATCDEWGLGETAAPSGVYQLALMTGTAEGAREAELLLAPSLVARTPVDLLSSLHRVRLRQTPRQRLAVHLAAPQTPDELGPRRQRLLQQSYRARDYVIDPNAVYLQTYTGQTAGDSARPIHEYLREHHPHLTLYWGVADHSVHVPEGAVPVVMRTREWYDVLGRAAHHVVNIDLDWWFVRRPGQRVLQTFHGYPAKSMGIMQWEGKRFHERRVEAELARTMRTWDLILTPDPSMDVHYRQQYRYEGPIANRGYPRDDVLVSDRAEEVRQQTRRRLGIRDDQTAVLYAPTFRDHQATRHRSAELPEHLDLVAASEALGDDFVLLLRGHRFHARGANRVRSQRRLLDVTDYPEINDLILASDAAVLDYSSLRFDFALTRRPMLFLVPDLDEYSGPVRGFLFDFAASAPGPLLDTADEVVARLRDLEGVAAEHRDEMAAFLQTYQPWQDGHATERVVREFFGDTPGRP